MKWAFCAIARSQRGRDRRPSYLPLKVCGLDHRFSSYPQHDRLDWVRDALHDSHADEWREHEEAIKRLRAVYDRLQNRNHAAYVDKLDGNIDAARTGSTGRRRDRHCHFDDN